MIDNDKGPGRGCADYTHSVHCNGVHSATRAYNLAAAQYARAKTNHEREQARGRTDLSVQQTWRMALAVAALQRATRRYADAQRVLFQGR